MPVEQRDIPKLSPLSLLPISISRWPLGTEHTWAGRVGQGLPRVPPRLQHGGHGQGDAQEAGKRSVGAIGAVSPGDAEGEHAHGPVVELVSRPLQLVHCTVNVFVIFTRLLQY